MTSDTDIWKFSGFQLFIHFEGIHCLHHTLHISPKHHNEWSTYTVEKPHRSGNWHPMLQCNVQWLKQYQMPIKGKYYLKRKKTGNMDIKCTVLSFLQTMHKVKEYKCHTLPLLPSVHFTSTSMWASNHNHHRHLTK